MLEKLGHWAKNVEDNICFLEGKQFLFLERVIFRIFSLMERESLRLARGFPASPKPLVPAKSGNSRRQPLSIRGSAIGAQKRRQGRGTRN
jgi:hypothetical protein